MNLRSDGRGWRKLELKKRSDVNWSSWHQGFFYNPNTKKNFFNMADGESTYNNEYLMRRDYQELYVRDETINALGDVLNKKGLDLGGGNGTYSHFLTLMGAEMSVQDLSESEQKEGLAQCRKIGINVEYKIGDAQKLQFKDESTATIPIVPLLHNDAADPITPDSITSLEPPKIIGSPPLSMISRINCAIRRCASSNDGPGTISPKSIIESSAKSASNSGLELLVIFFIILLATLGPLAVPKRRLQRLRPSS